MAGEANRTAVLQGKMGRYFLLFLAFIDSVDNEYSHVGGNPEDGSVASMKSASSRMESLTNVSVESVDSCAQTTI